MSRVDRGVGGVPAEGLGLGDVVEGATAGVVRGRRDRPGTESVRWGRGKAAEGKEAGRKLKSTKIDGLPTVKRLNFIVRHRAGPGLA